MARPDIAEARKLTDGEINDQIDGIRRELFTLRFEQAIRRLEKPHRFKAARIRLAQLMTVKTERSRATVAS